jgi:hypothetical protein
MKSIRASSPLKNKNLFIYSSLLEARIGLGCQPANHFFSNFFLFLQQPDHHGKKQKIIKIPQLLIMILLGTVHIVRTRFRLCLVRKIRV